MDFSCWSSNHFNITLLYASELMKNVDLVQKQEARFVKNNYSKLSIIIIF